MGLVYADFELTNEGDVVRAEEGDIPADRIRRMSVRMLVDTGCGTLAINENIRTQLGLRTRETRSMKTSDDSVVTVDIAGPVEVRFENCRTDLDAVVLPGVAEPLFGAIPMQDMDVLVDPKRHRLIVNPEHPIMASGILNQLPLPIRNSECL